MNFFKFKYKMHQMMYGDTRKKNTKNILVSGLAIICSIVLSLVIAMIIYQDGSLFYKITRLIFIIPFSTNHINHTVSTIAIFGVGALAFLIAFRSGLFNIGISGQMIFGAIAAVMFGQYMTNLLGGLGQILMLIISICFGGLLAGVIGALKAFFNMNEVVSSIVFNWIIYFVGAWLLTNYVANDNNVTTVAVPMLYLSSNNITLNGSWIPLLIIMLGCILLTIIFLGYTVVGKKIINTGLSTTGAQYAGYSVKVNQISAMVLSGAFAGILGVMAYCGRDTGIPCNILSRSLPQEGFNGISIGLIAMSNPWAVIPISVIFGMIDGSKSEIYINTLVDPHISDLMFGIVVYGAAIISFFYYVVPFKWYLRIFKGKIYEQHYSEYEVSMFRELSEVDDEIYLVKKKYRDLNRQIYNHKPRHFDVQRMSISGRRSRKQYREALNKIYQQHVIFKNMERQIFLMNILGVKKDNIKSKYDQWIIDTQLYKQKDLNYAKGNYLLEINDLKKTSSNEHLLKHYYASRCSILNLYKNKQKAGAVHYHSHYEWINKAYNLHRNLARNYRKELNTIKFKKEGE